MPALGQKFFETDFAIRQGRLGDVTGQDNAILVGYIVQDIYRSTITQQYALGVDSD